MATYLDAIIAFHRQRAESDGRRWQDRVETVRYEGPSLRDRIRLQEHVAVIAEVKRASPSKGPLVPHLDVEALARVYETAGATGISVLTDQPHFAGSADDLMTVVRTSSLPVLRKDFTVCANDVVDAATWGASTVLLIAAALSQEELTFLHGVARQLGLDALVEVHDKEELQRAVDVGADFIGVNQRNLHTFHVDPHHAAAVIERVPGHVVTVCESGLQTPSDVAHASAAGFEAVLVGERFVTSADTATEVAAFAAVAKAPR